MTTFLRATPATLVRRTAIGLVGVVIAFFGLAALVAHLDWDEGPCGSPLAGCEVVK